MARKPNAKRRALPKAERREEYSVILPVDLAERAIALASDKELSTAVEVSLKLGLDEYDRSLT